MNRESQLATLAYAAGIIHPLELANFMAQVCHESNGLSVLEESFRYSRGIEHIPVRSAWREGREALEAAQKLALQGKPESLAELMYGGRLGNDAPGDGWRYRGRGYIQLTGKDNYRAAADELRIDLLGIPGLAAEPETASHIAIWFWQTRVPISALQDVRAATLAINGGFNGLDDRQARFDAWEARLSPFTMQDLSAGLGLLPVVEQPPRLLREGMWGLDVRALQTNLMRLCFTDGKGRPLEINGVFGPGTAEAVRAFQRLHKLGADGLVGPRTLAAITAQLARLQQPRRAPLGSRSIRP
ncbi:peptidoglycan-binding protein [Luteibacter sp.]|uniref:peptidoglycan-binding protein n=1 Tax=Luteibacter sp. TaxID=1886636 RepID=UPI003F81718E